MVIESRFSVGIPNCSIQKWIFGSCSDPLPDRKAWIDADNPTTRYLTISGGRLLAKRIAVGLLEHGIQPGDRVLVLTGNSVVFPAIILGIWMAGGIFTAANPSYVARELAYQLKDSGARVMIATNTRWDVAVQAAGMVDMAQGDMFVLDDTIPGLDETERVTLAGTQHWTKLVASEEKGEAFVWEEPKDSKTVTCTLNYSSGTTGLPKGVEITHYNHVANGQGSASVHKLHPDYAEQTRRAAALCFLPMFHAFSQGYFVTIFPQEGIPVYVMSQFDLVKMLRHIEEFRITKTFAVPPILVGMSKHPLTKKTDLSSLDLFGSGAAPLDRETQQAVNKMLPDSHIGMLKQGWGMSELTCCAMAWDPRATTCEGVGELMPGGKARIVDLETGKEILEPGVKGELYVSAPTLMRRYWQNPEATAQAITTDATGTRWLRTGDIAYVAPRYESGTIFYIVDRVKELIKVRGFQVSPTELDSVLLEHQHVLDAAVVGVVKDGEEVPRAYVVRKPGSDGLTESEVEAWVRERVAPYKQLRGGVVFVDAIPKNPTGKILRKVLAERARQEMEETRSKL